MSRFLTRAAVIAATTALAAGTLVASVTSAADAAVDPAVSIAQAAPYVDGESITVNYSGFPASEAATFSTGVAVSICKRLPGTNDPYTGDPTECAGFPSDYVAIGATDASGSGSVTIKVLKGVLNGTWTCGPGDGHECNVVAVGMSNPLKQAKTSVIYKLGITSVAPSGRVSNGNNVTVRFTGAAASQTNAIGLVCDLDVPIGDGSTACSFASAAMATVDAAGAGVVTVKAIQGSLGNALGSTCGNGTGQRCGIVVTDLRGRIQATVPLAYKSAQALPAFAKTVKVGKKKALPRTSKQGFALAYASTTPKICKVVKIKVNGKSRKAVKGLKAGSCKVAVTSNGNATYAPVKSIKTIKVKR